MNRFADMLAAGYEPGKTYGASPLCFCGRRPVALVRVNGQSTNYCAIHYTAWQRERAR